MKYFYLGDDFMPGYVTHYIFGRDMYEKLNDPVLKNNLYKNRAVYALGHQGPDIFFYYLPAYVLHGHNLGDMAHTENTGAFYAALLESRSIFKKPEDLQIANAYLEGFLGHYILDSICHPFIYGRTHYKKNDSGFFFFNDFFLCGFFVFGPYNLTCPFGIKKASRAFRKLVSGK